MSQVSCNPKREVRVGVNKHGRGSLVGEAVILLDGKHPAAMDGDLHAGTPPPWSLSWYLLEHGIPMHMPLGESSSRLRNKGVYFLVEAASACVEEVRSGRGGRRGSFDSHMHVPQGIVRLPSALPPKCSPRALPCEAIPHPLVGGTCAL
jgi:hypothetical protein